MNILTILLLPIHKHGISFHLCMSSFSSFTNVFWFSLYKSFSSLVKLVPKYFIIFEAFVSEIFLKNSFYISLLVYRNTTSMLILNPSTLLDS